MLKTFVWVSLTHALCMVQLVNMGVPLTWSLVDPVTEHDPRFQACSFLGYCVTELLKHSCPAKLPYSKALACGSAQ